MKLLISGGRDKHLNEKGYQYLDRLYEVHGFTELVNGMAPGIDWCVRLWAKEKNIPIKEFPAKWNDLEGVPKYFIKTNRTGKKYNSKAGLTRNIAMLDYLQEGDYVIVFPGGSGSTHCLWCANDRDHLNVINLMDRKDLVE